MTSKPTSRPYHRPFLAGARRIVLAAGVSALTLGSALAAAPDAALNNAAQNRAQQTQQAPKNQQNSNPLFLQQQQHQQQQINRQKVNQQPQFHNNQAPQQQKIQVQPQAKPLQAPPQQPKQAQFQHYDWNTYRPGQRPPLWAQYRQNFDPRPYQFVRSAPRHYQVRYVPPPGWRYQRWNYGQVLPAAYWAQPYWVTNYPAYGLEPLPYGYVWVENGPDALAVDTVTGAILQVIYGLFGGAG